MQVLDVFAFIVGSNIHHLLAWGSVDKVTVEISEILFVTFAFVDYSNSSSLAINEEIYSSNWIIKDERLKKDLLFILLQSQKPKCITAGKFSKVSLNSFMLLLGSSFTYFTFIRSVYSPETKIFP